MKTIVALQQLQLTRAEVLETADVAAILKLSSSHASRVMERIADAGQALRLKRGVWALNRNLDRLKIPEYLTAPLPSYVSLQSALFLHGMISQIPQVIYAVSIARTRLWSTPLGAISIHTLAPNFFTGFEVRDDGIKLATPEKALVDYFYLSRTRSKLFTKLPELELPATFSVKKAFAFAATISASNVRTIVESHLKAIFDSKNEVS